MDGQSLDFPYEIRDVDPDLAKELMEHYTGEKTGFVQVGPKGFFYPQEYKQIAADIFNLPLRPDDIFVHSSPRSGTTLTQELVWLLQNNLDYEKAKSIKLVDRFPILEFSMLIHPEIIKDMYLNNEDNDENLSYIKAVTIPCKEFMENLPSPRFIKTHISLSLLPPQLLETVKIIHVARDPRDAAVSSYHLFKLITTLGAAKGFKAHWNYYIRGLIHWAPYFEQVKEAWNLRHHPNLLFLFYEDLTKDMPSAVRRVAKFLGKSYTDEQFRGLCDHLSFENFKINPSVCKLHSNKLNLLKPDEHPFVRKGKVGGWREHFDDEMREQADRWMADNLRDTDLRYPTYK